MARRRRGGGPCGVLLVDKPAGPTSHDVVGWVRRRLATSAVGHCGTLDPAATGLLVVCVGSATKIAAYLTGADKAYRARVVLGTATTTADGEGEIVSRAPVPESVVERVELAAAGLLGRHLLPPPAFSSVHVAGERAHALARRGEAVQLEPRPMVVHRVAGVAVGPTPPAGGAGPWVDMDVVVSKGTYVRSLAMELGRRVGVPAHLGGLRRLASGSLGVDDDACLAPSAEPAAPGPGAPPTQDARMRWEIDPKGVLTAAAVRGALRDPATVLPFAPIALTETAEDAEVARRLNHGQAVPIAALARNPGPVEGERAAVTGPGGGVLVARIDRSGERPVLRPERMVVPLVPPTDTKP